MLGYLTVTNIFVSCRVFAHRIEFGMDIRLGTNILGGHLILRELDIKIDIHDTHVSHNRIQYIERIQDPYSQIYR